MPTHETTALSNTRRLPLLQAIIYASGYFGVQLMGFSIGQIPQIYYIPEEGVALIAPLTIGGAILAGGYVFGLLNMVGRIVDGIDDPFIGNFSDHFRSRFGRRKPFILIGAPLMSIFLVLFTLPPSNEPSVLNIIWLAVIYPIFFFVFSVAITPYLAMIPEISRTPADRLLVTSLQSGFLIAGTFTGVVLVGMIPEKIPFTEGSILIGILACIPFLLVATFVKIPDEAQQEEITDRPSTIGQIYSALSYTPFRIYLLSTVAFWFGFKMIETSARYIAEHLFGNSDAYTPILGAALGVAALCGFASYHVGKKLGKRKAIILMSALFFIILPFVGLIGRGPFANPAIGYGIFALLGFPLSLLLIIPNSLLADIIDRNNEETGTRREALFFASQALINRIGIAFSGAVLNFLLPIGAIVSDGGRAAVGEAGVRLIGPISAFFILIGLLIFLKFPDMEKK